MSAYIVGARRRVYAGVTESMFSTAESTEVREAVECRPLKLRSRVTNGSKMIAGVDGRSAEARRYRDLTMSFADALGGPSSLTEAQRTLIAQAAGLTIQSEALLGAMLRGELVDVEQQTRVANAMGRTLNRLGIKKRAARKLTVSEYLERRDALTAAEQC